MTYTHECLLSINRNTELKQCVKDRINDLGICYNRKKRSRGRRSGTRVKQSSLPSIDTSFKEEHEHELIPTRVTYREHFIENRIKFDSHNLVEFRNHALRNRMYLSVV